MHDFVCGFRIYADIVFNHMSEGQSMQRGTGESIAESIRLHYPGVPYGPSDFNSYCTIKDSDYIDNPSAVRNCQLVYLNDLNQVHTSVNQTSK